MHVALQQAKATSGQAIDHLKHAFSQIQAGRASTALVEDIMVESYGSMMSLKSVATINTPDASTISIQPWDKGLVSAIEKAIQTSPLGLNPQSNSSGLIIPIPKPTEEKRKNLVKTVKQISEDSKVTLRNARHEALNMLKKEKEAGTLPEDMFFQQEKELQKLIDEGNQVVDELTEKKSAEIMTI
ncbi:MAG: ribosome recycling factor [Candidatus Abawacabacteria bacterium]|nr:ribosome recycling factor [Candidatus Abawacabacteria bacterium]